VSQRLKKTLSILAAIPLLGLVAWMVPPVRARLKAVAVLADAAGVPFPRPFAESVEVEAVELAPGVSGDMYVPDEDAPVVVFVPGAAPKGRNDPRVMGAAMALAKAGRRVFVPELTLYQRTFRKSDIDHVATAIEVLSRDGPIGVLAFSYGGSFALIAAADPNVAGGLDYVATFGAYFDLRNVLQAVTTDFTFLDGERVRFDTVPEARAILTSAAVRLAPESYADELQVAIDAGDPKGLPKKAMPLYDLLSNRDPTRTEELVTEVPEPFRKALDNFSPSITIDRLEVPVLILQSKKDAATPWTEAVLLDRAVTNSRLVMLNHFSHVDPPGLGGWLTDGPKAWWFLSWVIEKQE
jgi:pimeloyl-ACP methyl ester carboxylesterase